MRKKRHFTATHASLCAEGATKAEASANLEKQIDWALEYRPLHVESRFGLVIVIAANVNGYESSVFDPKELAHGNLHHNRTLYGRVDNIKGLVQETRGHAAQWMWDRAGDDEAHIAKAGLDVEHASALRRWIKWQRAYAAAKSTGATDNEAHNQACLVA